MKLGTRIAAAMMAAVISLGMFGLIASGLTVDKIMLAARPIVESVSVFSNLIG